MAESSAPVGAATASSVPAAPQTRTPEEWARELFPRSPSGRNHPELWRHGAAAALHRWEEHKHHFGPMQLTREDYDAALKAIDPVVKTVTDKATGKETNVVTGPVPHLAALSRHARKGV